MNTFVPPEYPPLTTITLPSSRVIALPFHEKVMVVPPIIQEGNVCHVYGSWKLITFGVGLYMYHALPGAFVAPPAATITRPSCRVVIIPPQYATPEPYGMVGFS